MRLFPLRPKALLMKSAFESRLPLARFWQLAGSRRNSVLCCALCIQHWPHLPPHYGGWWTANITSLSLCF